MRSYWNELLREISRRAGLDHLPVLYFVRTRFMNAFTAGTSRDAAVALGGRLRHEPG